MRPFAPFVLFAALTGCGVTAPDGDPNTLTPVTVTRALALGRVSDASAGASLRVGVNGAARDLRLADDGGFLLRDLPSGDLALSFSLGGATGALTVDGVREGEVLDLTLAARDGALSASVSRRAMPEPDDALTVGAGEVRRFGPGLLEGDLRVTGDGATLLGHDDGSCLPGSRTVIGGDLVVEGDDVRLVGVEVRGSLTLHGSRIEIRESCLVGPSGEASLVGDDIRVELARARTPSRSPPTARAALVGAFNPTCASGRSTTLLGSLSARGDDFRSVDVDVRGAVTIDGANPRRALACSASD
ncbi:MAG: hypothetical protein R3A52_15685 [Polyangiales bacterium]